MNELPRVSVIVNTYNRATQVRKAVVSVLSQSGVDVELVVVDDGSTDDTQAVLAEVADSRMRCIRQINRGLSASRNVGARAARGDWLLFLDDDDRLCDGALEALLTPTTDPSCRVVVGGVRFVDTSGRMLQERAPRSLDDVLAGTFLISRALFYEAGGYLEGMPCSHQTELFLRVRQVLADSGGAASFVLRPVVEIEWRSAAGRPHRPPSNAYFGERWIVARHPNQYTSRREKAVLETIAGVNAMRIGREADARRRFASAVRRDPLSPGRYLRLCGAIVTPVGRRIWLRHWDTAPAVQRPLDRLQRRVDEEHDAGVTVSLERDPNPGPDSLFMPWRYRDNPPFRPEGPTERALRYRAPMYKMAARLARRRRLEPVVEIAYPAESGQDSRAIKVPKGWVRVEGDLDDGALWDSVSRRKPGLLICSDLVQRVADPRRLLSGIRHGVNAGGMALISTPDRSRLRPQSSMGPPTNPRHIREWSVEEFSLLLESCGFEILRVVHRRHRSPSLTRRSIMGFLVRAV